MMISLLAASLVLGASLFAAAVDAKCAFPDVKQHPGLVCTTGPDYNDCWATKNVAPGQWLPYACAPGKYATHWRRGSASGGPSTGSMDGGLFCDASGNVVYDGLPLCADSVKSLKVVNKLSQSFTVCQTIYPGNEDVKIKTTTQPGQSQYLNILPASYWGGTSSHFYTNEAGNNECMWESGNSPNGRRGYYTFGGNQNGAGISFLNIHSNPLFTGDRSRAPNVELRCISGCSGNSYCRCTKDGCKRNNNGNWSPSDGSCVVTVNDGGYAELTFTATGAEFSTNSKSSGGVSLQSNKGQEGQQREDTSSTSPSESASSLSTEKSKESFSATNAPEQKAEESQLSAVSAPTDASNLSEMTPNPASGGSGDRPLGSNPLPSDANMVPEKVDSNVPTLADQNIAQTSGGQQPQQNAQAQSSSAFPNWAYGAIAFGSVLVGAAVIASGFVIRRTTQPRTSSLDFDDSHYMDGVEGYEAGLTPGGSKDWRLSDEPDFFIRDVKYNDASIHYNETSTIHIPQYLYPDDDEFEVVQTPVGTPSSAALSIATPRSDIV